MTQPSLETQPSPTALEVIQLLSKYNWVADVTQHGMWAVGPENAEGVMNVLGMGHSFMEALQMAQRTIQ